jgi:predicted RNase H-like HicB family nuclease
MKTRLTAILRQEEDMTVAFNPELDISSQGATPAEALANLREAVELFFEMADPSEIKGRMSPDSWITHFEAEVATA